MAQGYPLVVFTLDSRHYALPVDTVERVVRAVEITPLPKAPAVVLGLINLSGQIVPVFDLRRRFHLPAKEIALKDRFIIARTSRRRVAFVADFVDTAVEYPPQEVVMAESILPDLPYVQGVVKLKDGMVLIHDLDRFLSLQEEKGLEASLENQHGP